MAFIVERLDGLIAPAAPAMLVPDPMPNISAEAKIAHFKAFIGQSFYNLTGGFLTDGVLYSMVFFLLLVIWPCCAIAGAVRAQMGALR